MTREALLVVDLQNDFLPGGPLGVPGSDQVIPLIARLMGEFDLVVACQDWHPPDHGSFASQHGKQPGDQILLSGLPQMLWPDHCIQGTQGAEFFANLPIDRCDRIFRKGVDRWVDSYSAFFDTARLRSTGLSDYLRANGVTHLYVAGLATDYCVKHTILDALQEGFITHCIENACRGVELKRGDTARALAVMKQSGAIMETR
jgi:nicotinamidase/pyrazinamidase